MDQDKKPLIKHIIYWVLSWYSALGTGFAFVVFGIGGLLMTSICIPLIQFTSLNTKIKQKRLRWIIRQSFRLFFFMLRTFRLIDGICVNKEKIKEIPTSIIIANHPTLLDIVLILSYVENAICIIKGDITRNPFISFLVKAAGYISNEDGSTLIDRCAEAIQQGESVVIFPEGTRSPTDSIGKFRRGAAHMVIKSGAPIQTLFITVSEPILGKGWSWYQKKAGVVTLSLQINQLVDIKNVCDDSLSINILARNITDFLEKFYLKMVHNDRN